MVSTENMVFSTLAIPPGDLLEEAMEETGISKSALALRIGRPVSFIDALIVGDVTLTPEIASQLEQITDIPAHIWLGLENKYRLTLKRNRGMDKDDFLQQA